jgi:hypothetical protein
MDERLEHYFAAWNEPDAPEREALLRRALTEEAELLDPLGRWSGIERISERIAGYHSSAPGTEVVPGSGVDAHHDVERYVWKIVDSAGAELMEGLDVAERDRDGRLRRILMFHGPAPAAD